MLVLGIICLHKAGLFKAQKNQKNPNNTKKEAKAKPAEAVPNKEEIQKKKQSVICLSNNQDQHYFLTEETGDDVFEVIKELPSNNYATPTFTVPLKDSKTVEISYTPKQAPKNHLLLYNNNNWYKIPKAEVTYSR
jgi:hypothetical protein